MRVALILAVWFGLLPFAWASNPQGPMLDEGEESLPVGVEPEGAEVATSDEAQTLQSELAMSDAELRTRFKQGVALAIGQTAPWQQYSLAWHSHWKPNLAWTFQAGGGKFAFLRSKDGSTYEVNTRSQSPVVGVRAYLSDSIAIFVEGMTGLAFWSGRLAPTNGDSGDSHMKQDFTARGAFLGGAVGLANWWENGVFLEYQFIGTSKAWIMKNSISNTEASGVVNDELGAASSWGLLNVKVGWYF